MLQLHWGCPLKRNAPGRPPGDALRKLSPALSPSTLQQESKWSAEWKGWRAAESHHNRPASGGCHGAQQYGNSGHLDFPALPQRQSRPAAVPRSCHPRTLGDPGPAPTSAAGEGGDGSELQPLVEDAGPGQVLEPLHLKKTVRLESWSLATKTCSLPTPVSLTR